MRRLLLLLGGSVALADAPATKPPAPGGYAPDRFAAAAYEKARAAGAATQANPKENDPAAITAGQQIFQTKCFACHGTGGKGDGPAAIALDPRPADFTDHARWSYSTVGTRHWIVLNGIKGTGMASVGLSDDEAWQVIAYLKHTFQP